VLGTKVNRPSPRVVRQQNHALGLRTASEPMQPSELDRGHRKSKQAGRDREQTPAPGAGPDCRNPPELLQAGARPWPSAKPTTSRPVLPWGASQSADENKTMEPTNTTNVIKGVQGAKAGFGGTAFQ